MARRIGLLLVVSSQGININPNITINSSSSTIQLPIPFVKKNLASLLSDTTGTTAITGGGNDEGAAIRSRYTDRVILYSGWDRGLTTEVTIIAFGY